jgi:hypothetical protein
MKWFLILWVILGLAACANNSNEKPNPDNNRPQKPVAQNLSGKSTQEILTTKYNKANFKCDLWVQRGSDLIMSNTPNDSFSWDLLSDFANEKSFNLVGEVQDHTMNITVNVESVEIFGSVLLRELDGKNYKMTHTPVIKMDLFYEQKTTFAPGVYGHEKGWLKRQVREKLKDMTLNESHSADVAAGTFFNYLECSIETDIKPEYQDQFEIETH